MAKRQRAKQYILDQASEDGNTAVDMDEEADDGDISDLIDDEEVEDDFESGQPSEPASLPTHASSTGTSTPPVSIRTEFTPNLMTQLTVPSAEPTTVLYDPEQNLIHRLISGPCSQQQFAFQPVSNLGAAIVTPSLIIIERVILGEAERISALGVCLQDVWIYRVSIARCCEQNQN
jgi:hypothetical protein